MIPKRVVSPQLKTSLSERCLKGTQTDWDSPSSCTGTVRRRPPSLGSPKSIKSINVDLTFSPHKTDFDYEFLQKNTPHKKEIENGYCFSNEREKKPKLLSTENQSSKKIPIPIIQTDRTLLRRKTSTFQRNSSPSLSTCALNSKSNLPKFSTTKHVVAAGKKSVITNPQVEKLKENTTKISKKQSYGAIVNQHHEIKLSKNKKIKKVLGNGENHNETKPSQKANLPQNQSLTYTELYCDYPPQIFESNLFSPTSPFLLCKPKKYLNGTQKKLRLDDETPENIIKLTKTSSDDCIKNVSFAFPKFQSSSKLSCRNNRFFSMSKPPFDDSSLAEKKAIINASKYKDVLGRVNNSNDYILFNPKKENSAGGGCEDSLSTITMNEKSPTCDLLAAPEFSSSLFKNIPVRPRKGIPHLENYCLFDPTVDFVNEKELYKKEEITAEADVNVCIDLAEALVDGIFYDDQLLYDNIEKSLVSSILPSKESKNEIFQENCNDKFEKIVYYQQHPSDTRKKTVQDDVFFRHSSLPISTSNGESIESYIGDSLQIIDFYNEVYVSNSLSSANSNADAILPNQQPQNQKSSEDGHFDTLKQSFSSPQLQHDVSFKNRNKTLPLIESNYVFFHPSPVHTRNQYKIRQPRPVSTHSDADSGFLSPVVTPEGPSFEPNKTSHPAILVLQQCDSIQGYIEIYTDWANYYLERAKSKKKVADLSADCRDGLLLADVIEAVTQFKVPDLIKKPKTQQQMYDNVNSCLNVLRTHSVGGVESITTNDICSGRLKAVLALFFALSRFKQAFKQKSTVSTSTSAGSGFTNKHQQQEQHYQQQHIQQTAAASTADSMVNVNATKQEINMSNRQLPVPYSKPGTNGGTAIPLPATVLVQRRCPPDKVRPLPPTPGHLPCLSKGSNTNSETESRPGSPPNHGIPTHIPKGNNNSFRQMQAGCKIPASPYSIQSTHLSNGSIVHNEPAVAPPTKHSMLDKLKLFNKEKSDRSSTKTQTSKRTSSSSGFSSARSERSDSSLSLNDGLQPNVGNSKLISISKKSESTNILGSAKSKTKLMSSSKISTKDNQTSINIKSKKDKSPARNEHESKVVVSKMQKIPPKTEHSKIKQIPTGKKLDVRSESKTNLSQIPPPKTLIAPVCTNIPKPMAFIKGTTKPQSIPPQPPPQTNEQDVKDKLADISNKISISAQEITKMQIVAPMLTDGPINSTTPVHHMYNQQILNQTISMTESNHSKSTHSSSTGPHSNSSESSVIYCPSSESGSEYIRSTATSPPHKNNIQNRSIDHFAAAAAAEQQHQQQQKHFLQQQRQQQQKHLQKQQLSENCQKFHTVPSKMLFGNSSTIYEDEKQMTIQPMRPLLRGYNSHVTLPTRGTRGQHLVSEYCEDIGQGYCSDGDALRKTPVRYTDVENGYMSEGSGGSVGGGGIHGKHMISIIRTRSQLPTTIEERCRVSRDEKLDVVQTSAGNDYQSITTKSYAMEINGVNQRSHPQHRNNGNGCGSREHSWAKSPDQQNCYGQQTPVSPTSGRKDKNSPSHSRRSSSSSKSGQSRTKGVPQSFGYVKRTNGSVSSGITSTEAQQNAMLMGAVASTNGGGRTAHVLAVQRSNKVKVSGGTQTCSTDLQTKIPPNTQHRSFSLTGPGAAQLSQSIRERLSTGSHSLPKPGSELHVFQHRIPNRGSVKLTDGSLSDTQAYAEVKTDYSSYALWLKHSNTAASRLSEGDSMESLGMSPGNLPRGHKLLHRDSPYSHSPRLNRSNSIRSTKSEKMYPSMLSRGPDVEIEPYYCLPVGSMQSNNAVPWSQPTSPTPLNRGFGGPLSPTHVTHRLTYTKKNDEVHGSAASLLSGGSSLYGSAEERQANEVRRLKRELVDARDQVMSLSSQLSTNAHVVAAFEQSLTNMTQRLQQLSATADRKDGELTEMRQTIELLRKQSIQAGLTSAHMHSMNEQSNRVSAAEKSNPADTAKTTTANTTTTTSAAPAATAGLMQRHHSSDSMCSLNSLSSGCSAQDKKKKKGWLRSSFTKAFSRNAKISKTSRNVSTSSNLDNVVTSSSLNSTIDAVSLPPPSPTKSPHRMVTVIENAKPIDAVDLEGSPIVADLKKQLREKDLVLTDIRLEALSSASQLESLKDTVVKMRQEMMNLKQNNERLQKMVTSRSLAGSEVSLGAPLSPSGSMGEPRRYSLADGNLRPPLELPKSLDETEEENIPPAPAPEPPPNSTISSPISHSELTPPPPAIEVTVAEHMSTLTAAEDVADHTDGKKISIVVYLGQPESFPKYAEEVQETDQFYLATVKPNPDECEIGFDSKPKTYIATNRNEFVIAFTYISGKTTWQNLDYIVRKTFKDYLGRIDPGTNLGLNTDSITSYHLGEAKRGPEMGFPELLPCGYIVGSVKSLYICLQGVGSLAFESLIPRSIVHRYISLLTEHRRLILCGPSGTGKSYLARKLAEFLVARSQRGNPSEAIATFNVDHKSSKELRQYLGHIAEQASMSNGASELPSVIILDNLHHASALGDVFQVLLSAGPATKLPCIIGTMSQATCNTTNLQLHHNFRWVLTANHMEPVKSFLSRYLRRRLHTLELTTHNTQPQLAAVLAWLPTVWQHINRFLETHSSSDVTIGPRLFLSCPLDIADSQVWFTDVWNYHLEPYLVEAVREGVQLYGRRGGAWVDPSTFIRDTYPWPMINGPASIPPLRLINAEDVGLEGGVTGNLDSQDPLLNMLMRLQEAANYTGNQDAEESDCASLDSNITQDSSAGAE